MAPDRSRIELGDRVAHDLRLENDRQPAGRYQSVITRAVRAVVALVAS